jgi:hypothetical protein
LRSPSKTRDDYHTDREGPARPITSMPSCSRAWPASR